MTDYIILHEQIRPDSKTDDTRDQTAFQNGSGYFPTAKRE